MKVCPKCKLTYDDKYVFCKKCGTSLGLMSTYNRNEFRRPSASNNINSTFILIVVLVVVLALSGIGYYHFSQKVQNLEAKVANKPKVFMSPYFDTNHSSSLSKSDDNSIKNSQYFSNQSIVNSSDVSLEAEAISFFKNYHRAITNKDYRSAYNCLSSEMKRSLGSYDTYCNGYVNTIYSSVTRTNVLLVTGNTIKVEYDLQAKDYSNSSGTIIQRFTGVVLLQKNGDVWKIVDNHARKV